MPVIHYQSTNDRNGNRYQFAAKFSTSGAVLAVTDVQSVCFNLPTGFTIAVETIIVGKSAQAVKSRHRELSAAIPAPKAAP
jgi:hypothetical protein